MQVHVNCNLYFNDMAVLINGNQVCLFEGLQVVRQMLWDCAGTKTLRHRITFNEEKKNQIKKFNHF